MKPILPLTFAFLVFAAGCKTATPLTPPATPPVANPPPAPPPPPPPPAVTGYAAVPAKTSSETTYVFGWGDLPAELAKPRGGTTRGTDVTLAPSRTLPLPEITAATDAFARDRAAILALAGDYRVSFHFMESLGLVPNYTPQRPYHSWATEHVRVIADTGRFISLQHTLVMFFKNADGSASEPMLTKHWRQDWTHEPTELHEFRGAFTWARRRLDPAVVRGAWLQSVWQVDDSPRYSAVGRWTHEGNLTVWHGDRAWRPLPRREHTVRKDYDVMEGQHRIVLTPTGWLHEQHNAKRVAGDAVAEPAYVGHEIGLDRYERITTPSLAAADDYWRKTADYWAAVRAAWAEIHAARDRFTLREKVGDEQLFAAHFAYAEKLEGGAPFDAAAARHARETIGRHLAP